MLNKFCVAIVFFLVPALSVNAQFKKGDKMVGATIGTIVFNSGSSETGTIKSKVTSYSVNISPSLGWFIAGNTAVGVTLNINPNGQKTTYELNGNTYQSDKTNGFNIGAGGFVRSYFSDKSSFLPFGQASINGGISDLKTEGFFYGGTGGASYKQSYDGSSSGGFFFNATFSAGLTKMMSETTGLDLYIGYSFSYNKNTFTRTSLYDDGNDGTIDSRTDSKATTKFTNHGLLVGVGFQVFLRGKK